MGVHGLWQLIQSTGRPVTLESLEGKVLAVDVSIWLHHMVKGMRDRYGNPIPNAHLLGLFNRICKLLFYRIKPVFVFDGGVPELKKQTMTIRKQRMEEANAISSKAAKKLLSLMLKHHAVSTVLGTAPNCSQNQASQSTSSQSVPSFGTQTSRDIFQLNPLPEAQKPNDITEESDTWEERMAARDEVYREIEDLEDIDIESEDFKSLPPEIQHEILTDLKEIRKYTCYMKTENLPTASDEFSSYQLNKLMKQSHLSQHIDRVRKQMTMQESGDIAADLTSAHHLAGEIVTNRIMSEDSSHYILIKGLRNVDHEEDKPVVDVNHAVEEIFEKTKMESKLRQEAKTHLLSEGQRLNSLEKTSNSDNKLPETQTADRLQKDLCDNVTDGQNSQKVPLSAYRKLPSACEINLSSDDDDEANNIQSLPSATVSIQKSSDVSSPSKDGIPSPHRDDTVSINANMEDTSNHSASSSDGPISKPLVLPDQNLESCVKHTLSDVKINDDGKRLKVEHNMTSTKLLNEETSEEDDDFIEISINPNDVQPDDKLFPASIFTQTKTTGEEDDVSETNLQSEGNTSDLDIANLQENDEFEGMSQSELLELQHVIEQQTTQLKSVKQQQERVGASITEQMYTEAQELLQLFGLPYLVSPMEAEAQCAFLDATDQTEGTITDDSDIWLFGGKRVYKNFFNRDKHVEYYQASDIQRQMLLDRTKLINVALLCGSDYTDGIQGVGPVTAMEILGEFPGSGITPLQQFKNWWDLAQKQVKIRQETKVKSKLRQLHVNEGFPNEAVVDAYLNPTIDDSDESFSWGRPDLDLLRDYSLKKFGWAKKKIDDVLLPVMKRLSENQLQKQITNYFISESPDDKKLKSKRVRRILTRMRHDGVQQASGSNQDCMPVIQASKPAACGNQTQFHHEDSRESLKLDGGGWLPIGDMSQGVNSASGLSEFKCEKDTTLGSSSQKRVKHGNQASFVPNPVSSKYGNNRQRSKNVKQKKSARGRKKQLVNKQRVAAEVKLSESDTDTD